jgi:hypothetical protein
VNCWMLSLFPSRGMEVEFPSEVGAGGDDARPLMGVRFW